MFKQLMGYIQEYKKYFILAPLLVVGEAIAELLLPYLMGKIVDEGVTNGDRQYMFLVGGAMVVIAILGIFTGIYAAKFSAKASQGFGYNLRQAIFQKVQTFSFADVDKFSTASLVTRCTTDVKQLQQTAMELTRVLIRAPSLLIISMFDPFPDELEAQSHLFGGDSHAACCGPDYYEVYHISLRGYADQD